MKMTNIYNKVVGLALAVLTIVSCTDSWDDHYSATASDVNDGTLWEAIQSRPNELSNFAKVLQATGYDKALNSTQVLTVFAPTNDYFSADEADKLIEQYKAQYGRVSDEENIVLKEFLGNHIALYNYSVAESSNDSIRMMNGKKLNLTYDGIHGKTFAEGGKNQLYKNGLLFVVDGKLDYFPNVFEYFRKDADLDSVRNFLYSGDTLISNRAFPLFYERQFVPSLSVPGEIVNGKTTYLDSVFTQSNKLYSYLGYINSEDSTYWMVAPTNALWKELVEEYQKYFNYENNVNRLLEVGNRDSLIYTNTRLAILRGTTFSRTINPDRAITDSVLSVSAAERYTWREPMWGADSLCYYQYFKPFEVGGVFDGTENVECSNGQVMKASVWNFDKQQTFFQHRILQSGSYIKEVSRVANSAGDSIPTVSRTNMSVTSDNPFYKQVSGHSYMKFEPTQATNPYVTFFIPEVLSNIGYDIYLVTVPTRAGNIDAKPEECLPTRIRCTLGYHDQNGKTVTKQLVSQVDTNPDIVDHLLLASNFKFPVASWGLTESSNTAQVTLKVETRVSSSQLRNNEYTRTMNIDCIVLKPHVEAAE